MAALHLGRALVDSSDSLDTLTSARGACPLVLPDPFYFAFRARSWLLLGAACVIVWSVIDP